ncbi:hypothetical protein ACQJBY_008082 [Aegilops geniculata]
MAPVGVIPLPGGVVECVAKSLACLVLAVVSGRKPRFGAESARWRRSRRRHSVGSIVPGDLEFLCCAPPVFAITRIVLPRRNVWSSPVISRRWLSQVGSSPAILLPSQGGWCVDKGSLERAAVLRR